MTISTLKAELKEKFKGCGVVLYNAWNDGDRTYDECCDGDYFCLECKKFLDFFLQGRLSGIKEEIETLKYIKGFPTIKENEWITSELNHMLKELSQKKEFIEQELKK